MTALRQADPPVLNPERYLTVGPSKNIMGGNKESFKTENLNYLHIASHPARSMAFELTDAGAREAVMNSYFFMTLLVNLNQRDPVAAKPHLSASICLFVNSDSDYFAHHSAFGSKKWPGGWRILCQTSECKTYEAHSFEPHSDCCLWRGSEPQWLCEVDSEGARDWERLLLEGASLVTTFHHVGLSLGSDTFFILPLIYIRNTFHAEVSYMYFEEDKVSFWFLQH
jgi:hypothetical protein